MKYSKLVPHEDVFFSCAAQPTNSHTSAPWKLELDLSNDSFSPFRKPNFQATYVSKKSNYPRYVVKQIPKSINKRLTTIPKDEYPFKRVNEHYQEALIKGVHKHELVFNAEKRKGNKRKRKQKYSVVHPTG